jgi:UDP:flavonoid glycosyltransferase YjiC (YdhE family)
MKILYIINVDWFFISHFLPLGLEGIKRGYEVHISCGITDKKEYLEHLGFIVHPLSLTRSGTTLKTELKTIIEIYKIIKSINPSILEFFTIKPVLYGGIISRLVSIPKKVFYITGLGYVFIAKGFKGFIVRNIVKSFYRLAISGKNTSIITENIYDKELISNLNTVNNNQIKIIMKKIIKILKYLWLAGF